jgi:hypothetical protein
VYYCADSGEDAQRRRQVDVIIPRMLGEVARSVVYLSTDQVFGQAGEVHEHTEPAPGSGYGSAKRDGERAVLANGRCALVARVSAVFDDDGTPSRPFEGLRTITVADDRPATPTFAPDAVDSLLAIVETGRQGVVHLTGPSLLSDYELHQLAALKWGFDVTPTATGQGSPGARPVASPGVRLRSPSDVFVAPRSPPDKMNNTTPLIVFDCVGVVLGRRTWKRMAESFWASQDAWGLRIGPQADARLVADAYGPNPHFWRTLRALPPDRPRVLANNGPLASFSIWEQRYGFARIFDLVINSERDGLSKPSPKFFAKIGGMAEAGSITLIDDTEEIVLAARGQGWSAALSRRVSTWPVEEYCW